MFKLYETKKVYDDLIELAMAHAEENDGEIPDWLHEKIDETESNMQYKIISCSYVYKNYSAYVDSIKAEIVKMEKRKTRYESIAESVKSYIKNNMVDGGKIETDDTFIHFTKSKQTIIDDQNLIPDKFLVKKTTISPDKMAIKKEIANGSSVPGAHVETISNLHID